MRPTAVAFGTAPTESSVEQAFKSTLDAPPRSAPCRRHGGKSPTWAIFLQMMTVPLKLLSRATV